MKDDLYYIKKKYGEKMAHLCRKLFPTILEEKGKLFSILKDHFDYNRHLPSLESASDYFMYNSNV